MAAVKGNDGLQRQVCCGSLGTCATRTHKRKNLGYGKGWADINETKLESEKDGKISHLRVSTEVWKVRDVAVHN